MPKYIFVTGGVVSSVGKGITAAALGRILKSRHVSVTVQKLDPYLNVDPGTMSPYQHGEVYVTADGAETDLDLGHYERFLDQDLTRASSVTTGQIYQAVISRERRGDYLGRTIQPIPHVTNEIKERIRGIGRDSGAEVVILEVGGTVGDIEGQPFLEAIRQMRNEEGRHDTVAIHVTLLPYISTTGELKTKPTQHSVRELRSIGIQPDVIVCRSDKPISADIRDKISLFCDVEPRAVIPLLTMPSIYDAPFLLEASGLPCLGLCLGLHVMTVEFARDHFGSDEANSTEFNPETPYPVITLLDAQRRVVDKGGTMRLGEYDCRLVAGTRAHGAYKAAEVTERHRHRY